MIDYNKNILIIIIALIIFFAESPLSADTIFLHDGTMLVGKVIEEDDDKIIFKNAYGLFTIKHVQVKVKYITSDYKEDIDVHKKLGKAYDEQAIRENFIAGLKAKDDYEVDEFKQRRPWHSGKFFLGGSLLATTGRMRSVLPYGFGLTLSYDNSLDFLAKWQGRLWMPHLRTETGFMMFKNNEAGISGTFITAGPLWRFDAIKKGYGSFVVNPLAGVSFLKISCDDKETKSGTFTSNLNAGYEYTIGITTFYILAEYKYIYDRDVSFNAFGGRVGVGAKLW